MQALKRAEDSEEQAKASHACSRTGSRAGRREHRGDSGRPVGNEWLNIPARVQCNLAVHGKLAVEPGGRPGKSGGPLLSLNIIARKQ